MTPVVTHEATERNPFRGIAAKLVLSHVFVILVATAISTLTMVSLAERYFINADRQSLSFQAQLLASSCDFICLETQTAVAAIPANELPAASNVTQTNARDTFGRYSNRGGETVTAALTSTVRVFKVSDPGADTLVLVDAFNGKRASQLDGNLLRAAAPILADGRVVGAVEVSAPIDDARQVVRALRLRGFQAAAIALLVGFVLAMLRGRRIARPLRELNSAAAAVAVGDFNRQLPTLRPGDEVADLAQSFSVMRSQVQNQLQLRATFVADASHELRTPLASIKGYLELLQDGAAEKPDVRARFLASMTAETDRMVRLTDDLSLLSRSDSSTLQLRTTVVNWPLFVKETIDGLWLMNASRNLDIRASHTLPDQIGSQAEDHHVLLDPDRVNQVLANLLDNAIRHARTAIDVQTSVSSSSVWLRITDDGPGIPEDHQQRVFERFTRLDSARARDGSGNAGLGLSIVKAIVTAHGGTIALASAPNGGAQFTVELPRRFAKG